MFSISEGFGPQIQISWHRVKTAIITGANGFIGSHLLYRLLNRGWHVEAWGRSTAKERWADRVIAGAEQVGKIDSLPGQLTFHEVELSSLKMDIDSAVFRDSSLEAPILFHVAGDTRFRPADVAEQRRLNIEAPLELAGALRGRISRMVHVSTAYVAGRRTGLIRETELDCGQEFWNSYERSKFDAEVALSSLCRGQGIPLVIVRPAIIVNDRSSGRASTFTHLNALVEVVSRLQDYYGISDGQAVSKTIRLVADGLARPNLAPVDSILPPLCEIAESPEAPGKTFHLCHPHPQTNAEILGLLCRLYGVSHLLSLDFLKEPPERMSHTEEMVARSLKVYSPYLNTRLEFDLSNSRSLVADYDSYFSPMDMSYLRKVVDFQKHRHSLTQRSSST